MQKRYVFLAKRHSCSQSKSMYTRDISEIRRESLVRRFALFLYSRYEDIFHHDAVVGPKSPLDEPYLYAK